MFLSSFKLSIAQIRYLQRLSSGDKHIRLTTPARTTPAYCRGGARARRGARQVCLRFRLRYTTRECPFSAVPDSM